MSAGPACGAILLHRFPKKIFIHGTENFICQVEGPDLLSTQIVQRDRHAEFMTTLAVIASSVDRWATEFRHLQRTEVLEVEEFFSEGQKGSSAMPHKRNPITSERLSGLARVVRGNSLVALENVALWHERDISHSSAERIAFRSESFISRLAALREGLGIGVLGCFMGDREKALVRLPFAVSDPNVNVWLLIHVDLRQNARVRAFTEHAHAALLAQRTLFEGQTPGRSPRSRSESGGPSGTTS